MSAQAPKAALNNAAGTSSVENQPSRLIQALNLCDSVSIVEEIAWHYHARFTELCFTWRGDVWAARVKADFRGGPMVAFIEVENLYRCAEVVTEYVRNGKLSWDKDQYPPNVRKRRGVW